MNSLKYKIMRFMSGRYGGADKLNYFLLGLYLFFCILNALIKNFVVTIVLEALTLACMFVVLFRMFSRNIYKRRRENEVFLKISRTVLPNTKLIKSKWKDRKTHVYKKCPACKAQLRLKKIPGVHTAKCPRCQNTFKVKN